MGQEIELEPEFLRKSENSSLRKISTADYIFKVIDTLSLPFVDDFSTPSLAAENDDLPDSTFYQYKYRSISNPISLPSFAISLDTTFQTSYLPADTIVIALAPVDTLIVYNHTTYPPVVTDTVLAWPNYSLLDTNNSGNYDTTFFSGLNNDSALIGLIWPQGKLWIDRQAWINSNFALNMPSIGVATLDALNENGYLYSHGNTKPFQADSLTSKPIDLSPYSSNDSLYLSFMVQPGGRGDSPEAQDELILEFLKDDGNWEEVWASAAIDVLVVNEFKAVYVPVANASFFFKGFQFRFSNQASLSNQANTWQNNADLWHLDYIVLDEKRSNKDNYIQDACFTTTPRSHIEGYFTVPLKHYKTNTNLTSASSTAKVANYSSASNTLTFSSLISAENDTVFYQADAGNLVVATNDTSDFTQNYSGLTFSTSYFPGLNQVEHRFTPSQADLISSNNEASFTQNLEQFYAYDDGSSEAGYGINFFEGEVAVQYELLISSDTLSAIDLYFNNTLNQSNFEIPIQLLVWEDNNGVPGNLIYEGLSQYPKAVGTPNNFTSYLLDETVIVSGTFYVGWRQLSDQLINIGLDKQEDAKAHLFYNVGSGWKNSSIEGAIMVHPRFGFEQFLSTGIADPLEVSLYPNPFHQYIQVQYQGDYDAVQVVGAEGRIVHFAPQSPNHQYAMDHLSPGIYFLQVILEGNVLTSEKIIKY